MFSAISRRVLKTKGRHVALGSGAIAGSTLAFSLLGLGACPSASEPNPTPSYSCPGSAAQSCSRAREGMTTFLSTYTDGGSEARIANGETLARLLSSAPFGGSAMTWEDACTVELIVDYYVASGDPTFLPIANGYRDFDALDLFGGDGSINTYNDDKLWWALAFIQIYEKLGHDPSYLGKAESVFQEVCGQWNVDTGCGGGVTQTVNGDYENTVTNALLFQTAAKLYFDDPDDGGGTGSVTKNPLGCAAALPLTDYSGPLAVDASAGAALPRQFQNDYLGWALAEYEWFLRPSAPGQSLIDTPALAGGPIVDGLDPPSQKCAPTGDRWTYNSGPIIGALFDLSNVPADRLPDPPEKMLERAWAIADAAMTFFGGGNDAGILQERDNPTCGESNNCPEFRGIFMRYLARLAYGSAPSPMTKRAAAFIATNADAIWSHRGKGDVFVDCKSGGTLAYGCSQIPGVFLPLDWNTSVEPTGQAYQSATTSALDGLVAAIPTPSPVLAPHP
jgi:predicted alpha-1,6-mannanase (GH76 family)